MNNRHSAPVHFEDEDSCVNREVCRDESLEAAYETRLRRLLALSVSVVVLALFSHVLKAGFLAWDDNINVTQNPLLSRPWSMQLLRDLFDPVSTMRFRPLHWLVSRLVYMLDGLNPVVWHAFGWLLHGLSAAVLFLVLRICLKIALVRVSPGRSMLCAAFGALIWGLHPLRVEPVAWVTGSTYVMTGLLLLVSFWAYLTAYGDETRRNRMLILSWGAALCAYLTYPIGITYGFWLIAVDVGILRNAPEAWWRRWSGRSSLTWWGKHLLFTGPALISVGFTLWTRLWSSGVFREAPSLQSVTLWDRALMAAATLGRMVMKFICPLDLTPNQASFELQPSQISAVWICAVMTIVIVGLAFLRRKRHPRVWCLMLGYVVLCLPCLGLTENPVWPVDRYSYLGDMVLTGGVVGVLAWATSDRRWRVMAMTGMLSWVLLAGVLTYRLIPVWKDSDAFFKYLTNVPGVTDNPVQYGYLYELWGHSMVSENRQEQAQEKFQQANDVYMALLVGAIQRNDYARAINISAMIEERFVLAPQLQRERAGWWLQLGNVSAALKDLQAAEALMPDDTRTRELLLQAQKIRERLDAASAGTSPL